MPNPHAHQTESPHRLVYTTGSEGVYIDPRFEHEYGHIVDGYERVARESDPSLVHVAVDLSERLGVIYADTFDRLLKDRGYPGAISDSIGRWVVQKQLNLPRLMLLTPGDLEEQLARIDNDDHRERVAMPARDSIIINFRLPAPLEQFWHRSEPRAHNGEIAAASWGDRYRRLMDLPWDIISEWRADNPTYHIRRLNETGIHHNGSDGYYYLLEVSRHLQDEVQ